MYRSFYLGLTAILAGLLLTGCSSMPSAEEVEADRDMFRQAALQRNAELASSDEVLEEEALVLDEAVVEGEEADEPGNDSLSVEAAVEVVVADDSVVVETDVVVENIEGDSAEAVEVEEEAAPADEGVVEEEALPVEEVVEMVSTLPARRVFENNDQENFDYCYLGIFLVAEGDEVPLSGGMRAPKNMILFVSPIGVTVTDIWIDAQDGALINGRWVNPIHHARYEVPLAGLSSQPAGDIIEDMYVGDGFVLTHEDLLYIDHPRLAMSIFGRINYQGEDMWMPIGPANLKPTRRDGRPWRGPQDGLRYYGEYLQISPNMPIFLENEQRPDGTYQYAIQVYDQVRMDELVRESAETE